MSEIRTVPPKLTRNEWNALLDHGLEKDASYIIRKKEGFVQAVNGSTGKIDHSGTDLSDVVQSVLDGLSNGLIVFKNASYTQAATIVLNKSGLVLRGESRRGVVITQSNGAGFDLQGDSATNSQLLDVVIENLTVDGGNEGRGITSDSMGDNKKLHNLTIRNLEMRNFKSGTGFSNGQPCVGLKNFDESLIENCYLHGSRTACVKLYAGGATGYFGGNMTVRKCIIDSETATGYDLLIDTTNNSDRELHNFLFDDNHFYSATPHWSVGLVTSGGMIKHLTIRKCRNEGTSLIKHVEGSGTVKGLRILDCEVAPAAGLVNSIVLSENTVESQIRDCWCEAGEANVTILDQNTNKTLRNCVCGNHFHGSGSFLTASKATVALDNSGYNPVGIVATPFDNSTGEISLSGTSGNPVAGLDYEVSNADIVLTSTGGTGVSITVKSPTGAVVASGLASLNAFHVPLGFKIDFGAFTSPPDVTVAFC